MDSPEEPEGGSRWTGFKTIGEARGDYRPPSLILTLFGKVAIFLAFLVGGIFTVGLPLLRGVGHTGYNYHSKSFRWVLGGVLLLTVVIAVGAWVEAMSEEARTRRAARRPECKK